jgi:hypothetical protein
MNINDAKNLIEGGEVSDAEHTQWHAMSCRGGRNKPA